MQKVPNSTTSLKYFRDLTHQNIILDSIHILSITGKIHLNISFIYILLFILLEVCGTNLKTVPPQLIKATVVAGNSGFSLLLSPHFPLC